MWHTKKNIYHKFICSAEMLQGLPGSSKHKTFTRKWVCFFLFTPKESYTIFQQSFEICLLPAILIAVKEPQLQEQSLLTMHFLCCTSESYIKLQRGKKLIQIAFELGYVLQYPPSPASNMRDHCFNVSYNSASMQNVDKKPESRFSGQVDMLSPLTCTQFCQLRI